MFHHKIRLIACALLAALALASASLAEEGALTSGDYAYRVLTDGTAEITQYLGEASEVAVPERLEGLTVTGIGLKAFYGHKELARVSLPDTVAHIGQLAFFNLPALKDVTLGGGLLSIGDEAFANCPSLDTIALPDGLQSIGAQAFSTCESLASVKLPDSLTSLGDFAFAVCKSLTAIALPDSLTAIGSNPFMNCTALDKITVSEKHPLLEVVDGVLFNKADRQLVVYPCAFSATEYTVPDGTRSIGAQAFLNCQSLQRVTLPDGLEAIGHYAFSLCGALETMNIPDTVTSIGEGTFFNGFIPPYETDTRPLVLSVGRGSYAEQYAEENELAYTYADDKR